MRYDASRRVIEAVNGLRAAVLIGLSLSLGWGVRGNFGHEYGAMLPGALAALAGVLMLGRKEWLPRIPYFAFFGALGWAFGGSISYMQVIAYTHSGHQPSVYYGFFGLFWIGFLWAGMGGLATAWPAEASPRRLTGLFRPLCWVFLFWVGLHFLLMALARWEASTIDDRTWQRQASVLYWMDSDWIQALTAGLALMAFEVWDRRGAGAGRLLAWVLGGMAFGWALQQLLSLTGWLERILVWPLVQYQADLATLARLANEQGTTLAEIQADTLTNWPNVFHLFPQHVGWVVGAIFGSIIYFSRYGRFRSGASLLMWMVAGWFLGFLLMPVLLGLGGAGLRMTPPRGDNWAGIVGVFGATVVWLARHGYTRVIYAGVLSGLVGGFGFAAATLSKLMLVSFGNPNLTEDAALIEKWRFWQQSNWHSFLEQSYGLINGLGIFLALFWLHRYSSRFSGNFPPKRSRWTGLFAVAFVLFGVLFLNMRKNVPTWIEGKAVPDLMRLPGFESVQLSAHSWFCILWIGLTIMGIGLMRSHLSRPIEWMPTGWIGRGQLLYLIFLWVVVIMNFERALVRFDETRLLTEGVIFANAILASWMISRWPLPASHAFRSQAKLSEVPHPPVQWLPLGAFAIIMIGLTTIAMPASVRAIYGDRFAGHAGQQRRFGPDALWKTTPIFKSKRHS